MNSLKFLKLNFKLEHNLAIGSLLIAAVVGGINWAVGSSIDQVFLRWPPSPVFLLTGIGVVILGLEGLRKLDDLKNFPWSRTLLLLLGQNSFAIFLTHTFLLYAFAASVDLRFTSIWLTLGLWALSMALALYLAKLIPFNLRFDWTLFKYCACHWTEVCTHAQEHRLLTRTKMLLVKMSKVRDLLSVQVGGRRMRLFKKRQILLGFLMVLGSVTALGVADNYQIIRQDIQEMKGVVDREWLLVNDDDQSFNYQINVPLEFDPQSLTVKLADESGVVNYEFETKKLIADQNLSQWWAKVPSLNLEPGEYRLWSELSFYGFDFSTDETTLLVSHPLHVAWMY